MTWRRRIASLPLHNVEELRRAQGARVSRRSRPVGRRHVYVGRTTEREKKKHGERKDRARTSGPYRGRRGRTRGSSYLAWWRGVWRTQHIRTPVAGSHPRVTGGASGVARAGGRSVRAPSRHAVHGAKPCVLAFCQLRYITKWPSGARTTFGSARADDASEREGGRGGDAHRDTRAETTSKVGAKFPNNPIREGAERDCRMVWNLSAGAGREGRVRSQ